MIDFEFEFQYAEAKLPILRQVGGGIPAGRCVVLCGGSGCGKSTLLRCINGLIPQFYEGELKGFCRLNGQDTAGMRIGEIGELAASVFQDPRSQFFTVNSSNEVAFGLENHGLRSDGSSIETVLHELMNRKAEQTVEFFSHIYGKAPNADAIRLLMGSQFWYFRQLLDQRMEEGRMLTCLQAVLDFTNAGWRQLCDTLQ